MADLDVGLAGLGGKVHAHVKAVPPFGWVGVVALAAVLWLSWQSWNNDDKDTTSWTDPQQPPEAVSDDVNTFVLARARRWPGSCPGAC